MELKKLHSEDNILAIGFAESRIGGRGENQDSFEAKELPLGFVVTVCDGMGGGPGGKTASTIAVREILEGIESSNGEETVPNILIKAVRRANMAIIEAANETPELQGMGSTATVLLINEQAAYVAHVGDSRVYQFRGHKKIFRTFDHSMVFDLVKQGVITEEQARLSAQSNIITRALGIKPDVEVDVVELPYERGDRFMLTTDGIHGTMPEPELIKLATNHKNVLGVLTDDISTLVDDKGVTSGGGHDNLTIAIIETKVNSKKKSKMSRNTKLSMLAVAALCVISVVFNIIQCANRKPPVETQKLLDSISVIQKEKQDSINILSDSLRARNTYINSIKKRTGEYLKDEIIKEIYKQ